MPAKKKTHKEYLKMAAENLKKFKSDGHRESRTIYDADSGRSWDKIGCSRCGAVAMIIWYDEEKIVKLRRCYENSRQCGL